MSDQILKQFMAERIKRGMADKGWLQADLARETGISQMHLSRILREIAEPSIVCLIKISDALGVHIDEFFPDIPAKPSE